MKITRFTQINLLAILLFAASTASAKTHKGTLKLTTQAEVNAAKGITKVDGSVFIYDANSHKNQVRDLSPLSGLKEVTGTFAIGPLYELTTLEGLQSLSKVGSFRVSSTKKLVKCGLKKLSTVKSILSFNGNKALTELPLHPGIYVGGRSGDRVTGWISLDKNPKLSQATIDAFLKRAHSGHDYGRVQVNGKTIPPKYKK